MRDFAITAFIFGALPFAVKHPWIGVLLFVWLSLMTPHRFAWGFASDLPFAQLAAAATIAGLLFTKDEVKYDASPALVLLLLLPLWTCVTYVFALERADATHRLIEVLKIFLFVQIAAMVLRNRKQLDWTIWVIVVSVGYFGVKGGVFTILSGGSGRVYGPPGDSFLSDNNAIAVALIMVIPFMYYLRSQTKSVWIRHGMIGAIALSSMAVLGTYSRGGLLGVAAMLLFLWVKSRQKTLLALLIIPLIPLGITVMPQGWFDRMNTIGTYEQDASAMGRINAWKTAINIANDRPLVGGGFELYTRRVFERYSPNPDDVHAAHSVYFQMLGEHGYVGLLIFLSVGFAAWGAARRAIALSRNRPDMEWAAQLGRAFQVSLVGFAVGGAFVNIGYWDLVYYEIVIVLATCRLAATAPNREDTLDAPVTPLAGHAQRSMQQRTP